MRFDGKFVKFFLKSLGSLFFVWWILFAVNWLEIWSFLQKITRWQIVMYMVLYVMGMIFSSYKWKFLAKHKGISLPFKYFFKSYFTATFINNFFPSFIGGDGFKIYYIGKKTGKLKESASSVFMDRLTGLWGAMFLAVIFFVLNLSILVHSQILIIINILIIAGLIIWFFILELFKKRIISVPNKKIGKTLNIFINEINHYNGKTREIWKAILLSFPFNFIGLAGANYILFLSMGIDINLLNYLSVIFLISIVSSVPITINNIGIKEWAYITFFGFFGLNSSAVISVAILSRFIQMIISFFALPIYLIEKKK